MKLNVRNDSIDFGTNILTVEVPKALRNKVKSGIEYVDGALGGEGFTPSQVVLFTGTPGAGKTTMTLTMADRLTKGGAIVVFNTAEESLFQVKRTVNRLGIDANFLVGGETNVDEIIKGIDLLRAKKEHQGKQVFLLVDSLQCLDDGHFTTGRITTATAERSLEKLTTWAKENFCSVIVIGQVTKGGQFAGSNKMKHMVDCHMHLSWEKKDKDLLGHRKFEVEKNRFGGTGRTSWLSMGSQGFEVAAIEEV